MPCWLSNKYAYICALYFEWKFKSDCQAGAHQNLNILSNLLAIGSAQKLRGRVRQLFLQMCIRIGVYMLFDRSVFGWIKHDAYMYTVCSTHSSKKGIKFNRISANSQSVCVCLRTNLNATDRYTVHCFVCFASWRLPNTIHTFYSNCIT